MASAAVAMDVGWRDECGWDGCGFARASRRDAPRLFGGVGGSKEMSSGRG